MNQDQLNKIRMAAGLAPKYDRAEREHLAEKATQKSTEQKSLTEAANNRAPANVIKDIARRHLNIRSLETQNVDEKDFHEVSVWAVEAALKAAFKAGQDVTAKKMVKEADESKSEVKKAGVEYDPKGGERYPEDDCCDPDEKVKTKEMKKGKSAENYKTPKNKTAEQMSEAKKADCDYDSDGKVETPEKEYKGSRDKAIKKAMKKKDVKEAYPYPLSSSTERLEKIVKTGNPDHDDVKAARTELERRKKKEKVSEGKKADKDYDKDGKVESPEAEYKGSRAKAIEKAKKKEKMNEMDLELDMGDSDMGGADELKQRRLELIRRAAEKVRGAGDIVDVGDPMDDEGSIEWPEEVRGRHPEEDNWGDEEDLTGEMGFGGGDFEFDEEDCEYAMSVFQPEDEEAYALGFDAFRKGAPMASDDVSDDFRNGYETARMTRMSAVAEGSSATYDNPKGTRVNADAKSGTKAVKGNVYKDFPKKDVMLKAPKVKADASSGMNAKTGRMYSDVPHKDNSMKAKAEDKSRAGLKKIGEAADATVFDKEYHHPAGANGHWDMAQHKDKPHVQDGGQMEKVKVPTDIKKALRDEIAALREDSGKVRYRDEDRADFYENTAEVFEMLLHHLEEGTRHSLLLAQIDMNRVMSPMVNRLPRNVYMYIVRGGKPASLNELFYEVKVKADKGADLSKEDYTK